MKKSLLIIAIMALVIFSAQSQTRQDSTVIANKDARALLNAFDEWKTLKPENRLLSERIELLEWRIGVKDSTLEKCRDIQIELYKIIDLQKVSEANLIAQRKNLQNDVRRLERKVRSEKTKTFIGSLAGVVATVAILIFK